MADKILYANVAKSTLAAGITDVATSLSLQPGDGTKFPNPAAGQYFKAKLKKATGEYEMIHCTARSVDTLTTIVRAQEGTAALAFSAGDKIEVTVSKETLETFPQRGVEETITGNRIMDGLLKSTNGLTAQTAINYVLLSGTNTYTGTLNPALTAYVSNMRVLAKVPNANTGAVTINLNGLGAKSVKHPDGSALTAGWLPANCLIEVRYDGTDFILMSVSTRALPANVPRRQTVLTGGVDANGQANFLNAGTGLAVDMDATATAVRAAIAAGFDCQGQVDYIAQFSADQANYWSGLPASNLSFLMLDRNGATGAISAYNTLVPPQYGAYFDKTAQALLHFEGADASTTITDVYGNAWTAAGNAQIDTAQFKFGSSAGLMDGTTDYFETTDIVALPGGTWTIEGNFRRSSTGVANKLFGLYNASGFGLSLGFAAGSQLQLYASSNGTSHDIANAVASAGTYTSTAAWYHIAVVFDGAAIKVYVDNAEAISVATTAKICSGTMFRIGANYNGLSGFAGWVDEFRISPCVRYTGAGFTVPVSAFSADAEWFDLSEFKWKYGAPGAWTEKQRVCVGEATTGAAAVSSTTTYALRGQYDSGWFAVAVSTTYSKSHNLGVVASEYRLSYSANASYPSSQVTADSTNEGGIFETGAAVCSGRTTSSIRTSPSSLVTGRGGGIGFVSYNAQTGLTASATVGYYRIALDRGW